MGGRGGGQLPLHFPKEEEEEAELYIPLHFWPSNNRFTAIYTEITRWILKIVLKIFPRDHACRCLQHTFILIANMTVCPPPTHTFIASYPSVIVPIYVYIGIAIILYSPYELIRHDFIPATPSSLKLEGNRQTSNCYERERGRERETEREGDRERERETLNI